MWMGVCVLAVAGLLVASGAASAAPSNPPDTSGGRVVVKITSVKKGVDVPRGKVRAAKAKLKSHLQAKGLPQSNSINAADDSCETRFQSCEYYTGSASIYATRTSTTPLVTWSFDNFSIQISESNQEMVTTASLATNLGFVGDGAVTGEVAMDYQPGGAAEPDRLTPVQKVQLNPGTINQSHDEQWDWYPPHTSDARDVFTGTIIYAPLFEKFITAEPVIANGVHPVRCDNVISANVGCVNPRFRPVLYSMNSLPNIKANILNQMAKGAPSWLTRLTDPTQIAANRNVFCPPSIPRPAGKSCDEYPFASSYEGGGSSPGGYAMVPESENNSQGGLLSSFYSSNRVLDGDGYIVDVGQSG